MSADLIATVATIRVATGDLIAALVAQGRDVDDAAELGYGLALDAADEARVSALARVAVSDAAPVDENDAPTSDVVQSDAGAQVSGATPVDDSAVEPPASTPAGDTTVAAPAGTAVGENDGATAQVDTGATTEPAVTVDTNAPADEVSAQVSDTALPGEPVTGPTTEMPADPVSNAPDGTADALQPNNTAGLPEYTYSGDPADLPNATDWTQVGVTADGAPLFVYAGDTAGQSATGDGLGGVWHLATPPAEPVDISGQPSA